MARNGDRSPLQKRITPDVCCSEQTSKPVDKLEDDQQQQHQPSSRSTSSSSTSASSCSSRSSSATRRRPWKKVPTNAAAKAASSSSGAATEQPAKAGEAPAPIEHQDSRSSSNRHLLVLRRPHHSAAAFFSSHRFRRDFRSCCFCCFCCCTCSCTDILPQRAAASSMASATEKPKSPTAQSLEAKKPLTVKEKDAVPSPDPECSKAEPLPSLEEIRSWGESFDQLMKCSAGRQLFREFLQCEYSEENILFWLACEDLKKERDPELIEEKARLIYEDFVSILSPREVSLDSKVREIVNQNMARPTVHTFDEAQMQIYTLMHRDSYPRFLASSLYRRTAQLSPPSSTKSSVKVG